jgi:CubicO group peptidase (beta-lactamase class C family)
MPRFEPDRLDTAFDLARRQVDANEVPFVILAIAGADGLVRLDAFSPAGGPRTGSNAVCLLASITKPVTASLVIRLVESGRFPLTVPLTRWLPELDAAGLQPFTAWHVLSHTTGLTDIAVETVVARGGGRDEVIRQTIAQGQRWAPGSRFLYTTFTFDLLALAVERALARPFEEILREEILDPLAMTDTTFDMSVAGGRRAPIVLGSGQPLPPGITPEQALAGYASLRLAGGGLFSTATDLVRFGRAMLRGGELDGARVLGRTTVELMTREVTDDGLGRMEDRLADEHYALGWGKRGMASPASASAFGHGGISGTRLWIDPAHDLVFVYLTGAWGGARVSIDAVQLAVYAALA